MGGKRYLCRLLPITFSAVLAAGVAAGEFEITLAKARDAARHHRYLDVVELLTPYNSVDDPEVRYITAAEIGRAYFHLGHYHESYRAFRQAVRLRPDRVETALYLRSLSLFHVLLPPVMVFLLRRLGYDRRALLVQILLTWAVLVVTYVVTVPADNINLVFGLREAPQTWIHPRLYLALEMMLLPLAVFYRPADDSSG